MRYGEKKKKEIPRAPFSRNTSKPKRSQPQPWKNKIPVYSPLIKIRPHMDHEHHKHQHTPPTKRPDPSADPLLIEQKSDTDRPYDLREPIDKVVQRASADVEYRRVEVVEF